MDQKQLQTFEQKACSMGAVEAKIIDTASIVVAPWVLFKCRYGCDKYNTNLCCPPFTPKPQETRELIECYRYGLLFQCRPEIKPRDFIFDLEREIFLSGYYKAIGLSSGSCRLCDKCNLNQCVYPDKARPSMEACGIDIFSTARANDMNIKVLTDTDAIGTWYGLVLID